jgi:hypothetical protein
MGYACSLAVVVEGIFCMRRIGQVARVGGAAVAAGAVFAAPVGPAAADKAPFAPRYADNNDHTYTNEREGTTSLRNKWGGYFDTILADEYDAKTQLGVSGPLDYSSNIDLYWYLAPDTSSVFVFANSAAETSCQDPSGSTECNRWRIAIKDSADTNLSSSLQKNLVCHETGHTVGFRDGGDDQTSCMDGGDNSQIKSYEIGKINDHY